MQDTPEDDEEASLDEEFANSGIALTPSETADPQEIVASKVPKDILELYEVYSYRNAAVILSEARTEEFKELLDALRAFRINTTMIRRAGGNESDIPKLFSKILRPLGWHETIVQGDLLVKQLWKEQVGTTRSGKPRFEKRHRELLRERYLDGHK
ncbi:MAG: restriction endonuclease, partial [Geminicoccaceae bacterium]